MTTISGMATRKGKAPGVMRGVVARNVKARMDLVYSEAANKPMSLSKDAGMALSSVQRVLSADVGVSVDNLERLAMALDTAPYQLLLPDMDPHNPQVVQGASAAERRLYLQLSSRRKVR